MTRFIKRKLIISDIHGMYEMLLALLKKVKYNPLYDRLFFLGDMVDKGPHSRQVLEFVNNEVQKNEAIFILGNHDDLLLSFLKGETDVMESWVVNGGLGTLESYVGNTFFRDKDLEDARKFILKQYAHHYDLLNNARLFYEDASRIYVHAGINPYRLDWRGTSRKEFLTIRDMFYRNPIDTKKTVVFGHTPTINMHDNNDIWFEHKGKAATKIGIDGMASRNGQLNCLIIENDKQYFQEAVRFTEITGKEIAS